MPRKDISNQLIHFTKGETLESAYENICSIINQRRLIGGNGAIKGGHKCVCFSEAPLQALGNGLLNSSAYTRYSPFGILFEKKWIFDQGGRPVIYQSDSEYDALPDTHKWRHVRYEPNAEDPIDFTWEREWRIPTEELTINHLVAVVVVPTHDWVKQLEAKHESDQDFKIRQYSQIMEEELAMQYRDRFDWRIHVLNP